MPPTPTQYLLDTNILSETRKRNPDLNAIAFLTRTEPTSLYLSVLTLGELRKGVAHRLRTDPTNPTITHNLAAWVDGLEFGYTDRILPIDAPTARLWGELSAQRPRPVIDTLLAATALTHSLTLVTRNTTDIADIPNLQLLNPFTQ